MLSSFVEQLPSRRFRIDHLIDRSGRYQLQLDPEFPFAVQSLSYDVVSGPTSLHWHEHLEIFVPVTGTGEFRMGRDLMPFSAGDLLIVDNLKLHGLTRFTGEKRTAVVITFLADLVYRFGSPSCDFLYLTPFYCQSAGTTPLIPATHSLAPALHSALEKLLHCYLMSADGLQFQVGCKAYLLELLYTLTQHFGWSEVTRSVCSRQKNQARRLGNVYDYVKANYSSKMPVSTVAAMAGMSESHFMRYFKEVTGMTFVQYVTHVRLLKGCHLLRESDLSIVAIADRVGFSDQSYFDKKFREHFSRTPSEFRSVRREAERAGPPSVHSPG